MAFSRAFRTLAMIITALLRLLPVHADIYRETPLKSGDLISWEIIDYTGTVHLRVSRISSGRSIWSTGLEEFTFFYTDQHELPFGAYSADDERITFPVDQKTGSGRLVRYQIGIDTGTGKLLWKTAVPAGLSQQFFYSMSDTERLLINNCRAYLPPLLTCVDLDTGKIVWEREGLPEPAAPLQTDQFFVLHTSRLNNFLIIDKESGRAVEGDTLSPLLEWNGRFVLSRRDGENCTFLLLDPQSGREEKIFTFDKPLHFFRQQARIGLGDFDYTDVLPVALHGDTLILQGKNDRGNWALYGFLLTDPGRIRWTIEAAEGSYFETFSGMEYQMSHSVNFGGRIYHAAPMHSGFYRFDSPVVPLMMIREEDSRRKVVLIDCEKGTILKEGQWRESLSNLFPLIPVTANGHWFLFYQRFNDEVNDSEYIIMRIDPRAAVIDGFHQYHDDFDRQYRGTSPFHLIISGHPELIDWQKPDSENLALMEKDLGIGGGFMMERKR